MGDVINVQEEAHAVVDGMMATHSNLRCFLDRVTPVVEAHKIPKVSYLPLPGGYYENITSGVKCYYLRELWNKFYEWSVCGVGTSVCISPDETIVQYFVPYLSAIQLYTNKTIVPASQSLGWHNGYGMGYDRNIDEYNQQGVINWIDNNVYQTPSHMSRAGVESKGELFFKYFELESPYERIPFVDKVYELCYDCPGLESLSSADLSPSSWMSVLWYPISHVPVTNKKYINTSFLTYHSLSTSEENVSLDNVHASNHMALAPFGLVTCKLDMKVWATPNSSDQEHISSLFSAAQSWLKKHNIYHHDFNYFSHSSSSA